MKREEAKICMSIPREILKVIAPHIYKNLDIIQAYANGAEIQYRSKNEDEWEKAVPLFREDFEYRVKPNSEQPTTLWKPKDNERFLYVGLDGEVMDTRFNGTVFHHKIVDFGNCFKSYEEAEEACDRVRAALRGEVATKKEVVESLDGEPLGDYEKELLRVFRKAKLHEYCMIENVVKFESVKGCGIELLIPYDNGRKEFFNAIKKFTKEKEK